MDNLLENGKSPLLGKLCKDLAPEDQRARMAGYSPVISVFSLENSSHTHHIQDGHDHGCHHHVR
jgi:hypothetical protein